LTNPSGISRPEQWMEGVMGERLDINVNLDQGPCDVERQSAHHPFHWNFPFHTLLKKIIYALLICWYVMNKLRTFTLAGDMML